VIFTCSFHSKELYEEKDLEPTMKLNFLCYVGWTSNHKLFLKGHVEAAQVIAVVYRGAERRCREIGTTFWEKKFN
jgi:hypothetical protein